MPVIDNKRLCEKYRSVILKGFLPNTAVEEILKQIPTDGIPSDYSPDSVLRNEKTGVLTLLNLSSDHCLVIMESMHTKKFLGRKIFVNCVVPNSPAKGPADTPTTLAKSSTDTGNPVIDEPKSSDLVPLMSSPVLDPRASSLAASKTVNCQTSKITKNDIEEFEFSTPLKSFSQRTDRPTDQASYRSP